MSTTPSNGYPLMIERTLNAPRMNIWRCWTEPELLKQWFCPKPWTVVHAQLDVRAGGSSNIIMQGPDGQQVPNPGMYLEVIPGRRLVFTDAFSSAWVPAGKPFMVGEILLEDTLEGTTHYLAKALHWNAEDQKNHEQMGFQAGWNVAADQLEALARTL